MKNIQINSLISQIESYVLSLPYTKVSSHQMGGLKFLFEDKEIGHIHWNGDLDILFTKAILLINYSFLLKTKQLYISVFNEYRNKLDLPNKIEL